MTKKRSLFITCMVRYKLWSMFILVGIGSILLFVMVYCLTGTKDRTENAVVPSDSVIENCVFKVFRDNTDARMIFEVVHQEEAYDETLVFGRLKIRTTMEGKFFINTFSGHSWLEADYGSGWRTTFALHGKPFSSQGKGYRVNWDLDRKVAAEMSMFITYKQLQQILDYNKIPGHVAWTLGYNCTDYAIEIWNLVSPDKIPVKEFGSLVTPKELTEYIQNR